MGDVVRALGGSLAASPVDATHSQRYFGELKRFGAIDDLITIVTKGVSVKAAPSGADLARAPQYGSHQSAAEHLPTI